MDLASDSSIPSLLWLLLSSLASRSCWHSSCRASSRHFPMGPMAAILEDRAGGGGVGGCGGCHEYFDMVKVGEVMYLVKSEEAVRGGARRSGEPTWAWDVNPPGIFCVFTSQSPRSRIFESHCNLNWAKPTCRQASCFEMNLSDLLI